MPKCRFTIGVKKVLQFGYKKLTHYITDSVILKYIFLLQFFSKLFMSCLDFQTIPRQLWRRHKAVIARRLRPRCCHMRSYSTSARKVVPCVRCPCNWYYCAEFIARPKAACALRFSWAPTSSNLGLWADMTSSIKPEVHNVSLRRQRRTEPQP